jgi:hypothetical protein
MKKLPYTEGDWFAVPLGNDRYGVGLIARSAPQGKILLGYFFDRFFHRIPRLSQLDDLTPDEANEVVRFGDLSLFNGEWPILGSLPKWDRSRWPIPFYIRRDTLSKKAWRMQYSDEDPSEEISETPISYETSTFGRNSLLGAGAVEITLRKIMDAK